MPDSPSPPTKETAEGSNGIPPFAVIVLGFLAASKTGWGNIITLLAWVLVIVCAVSIVVSVVTILCAKTKEEFFRGGTVTVISVIATCFAWGLLGFTPGITWLGGSSARSATLAYWSAVHRVMEGSELQQKSRQEIGADFLRKASELDVIPKQHVDADLLVWGAEVVTACRDTSVLTDSLNAQEVQLLVRAFVNGSAGNVLGVAQDAADAHVQRTSMIGNIETRMNAVWGTKRAEVRAKLKRKYGSGF
ncbi:MAG: hypothetical protein AABP62_06525 [Planctomycetota bacterium]